THGRVLLPLSNEYLSQFAVLAKQQAALCNKDASLLHSLSFGHTGWNIHLPADGAASFSNITDDWFEEGKYFLYYSGRCRENAICQHYTQLVWATSSHVGCASQQCLRDGLLWKIFAGVILLVFIFESKIPKNPCRMQQHGRLNLTSCKCECDLGFTGRFCQGNACYSVYILSCYNS
uniref:SCP domain-containing protein n=1 Tax=Xiphophorus maculatus TaxID=8083 RepID=M3ZLA6_XIPMA